MHQRRWNQSPFTIGETQHPSFILAVHIIPSFRNHSGEASRPLDLGFWEPPGSAPHWASLVRDARVWKSHLFIKKGCIHRYYQVSYLNHLNFTVTANNGCTEEKQSTHFHLEAPRVIARFFADFWLLCSINYKCRLGGGGGAVILSSWSVAHKHPHISTIARLDNELASCTVDFNLADSTHCNEGLKPTVPTYVGGQ